MILLPQSPKRSLNKAYLKQRPLRSDIDLFKVNLKKLLSKVDEIEREENQKNHIRDFLRDTFFKDLYEINTKDTKDLVVHLSKSNKAKVAVIIEAKRPTNKTEMITKDNLNAKGFHELILYYFDERTRADNNELKHLIISNVYEWFIFDANYFDKLFFRNTKIKRLYDTYINDKKDTPFFYEEIRKIIPEIESDLPCAYFDIRDYQDILLNEDTEDDKDLIALYKVLSAVNILKLPFAGDSNKLDEKFYKELLHIIGLEEVKEKNKLVIRRKGEDANPASLIENTINILETEDVIRKVPDISSYGATKDDRLFNIALELVITWINRILFLKLLEAQLVNYHKGDKEYRFLSTDVVEDYDELFKLFHQVLARTPADRTEAIRMKYNKIPYLNSSLFEISELEDKTIKVNSLDDSEKLELISNTVLKEDKKKFSSMPTLEYLFRFLDAYDFASEGTEDIQEDSKTLINASVLGKVFEKINGYKDGSIFTPGFITMYMCRESIRLAVLQKFKEVYNWNAEKFEDLNNYVSSDRSSAKIKEHNNVINSLRICDPAVGSGHFLVSSLNEIIAIKSELGILADESGVIIRDYDIVIENDELIVTDYDGDIFEYTLTPSDNGNEYVVNKEAQRLQKTLFHEKQAIIENCLFGVDINPNSVKICRLRLWIELLKNAYYRDTSISIENNDFALEKSSRTSHHEQSEGSTMTSSQKKVPNKSNLIPQGKIRSLVSSDLETLPNIDINIKCGNSLISRFPLDSDLGTALKKTVFTIEQYRDFVSGYRNEKSRDKKRDLQNIIDSIKTDFRTEILNNDPKLLKLNKLKAELDILLNQEELFEESVKQKKTKKDKKEKLEKEINKLASEIDEIKTNAIYRNAFEWRFEFPEVLSEEGQFEGFDVVIGNPPYGAEISDREAMKTLYPLTSVGQIDTYKYFVDRAINLVNTNRIVSYITSDSFLQKKYFEDLRMIMTKSSSNLFVIKLGDNIFEGINLPTAIFILVKGVTDCKTLFSDASGLENNEMRATFLNRETIVWSKSMDNRKSFSKREVIINEVNCARLIELYDQVMGVKVYQVGKGKPKQTDIEKLNNSFIATQKLDNNYMEFISQGIGRYCYETKNEWIKYGVWLAEPRDIRYFINPKVIIREIVNPRIFATYIERNAVVKNIAAVIIKKSEEFDLKYLLGLINSKLFTYYLYENTAKGSNKSYPSFSSELIKSLPIKLASKDIRDEIATLVDRLLQKGGKNCSFEDSAIDRLVFDLYDIATDARESINKLYD